MKLVPDGRLLFNYSPVRLLFKKCKSSNRDSCLYADRNSPRNTCPAQSCPTNIWQCPPRFLCKPEASYRAPSAFNLSTWYASLWKEQYVYQLSSLRGGEQWLWRCIHVRSACPSRLAQRSRFERTNAHCFRIEVMLMSYLPYVNARFHSVFQGISRWFDVTRLWGMIF